MSGIRGFMDNLTPAQARVLDAIRRRIDADGAPPTYRELQEDLGFNSTASVRDHLRALERKGFVQFGDGRFRSIRLNRDTVKAVSVPILGRVIAGLPTPSQENLEGFVEVPSSWVRGDTFALRVYGDSMVDEGILEGDIAIVRRDLSPSSGHIVCATLAGESTLKMLQITSEGAWLVPANRRYSRIPLPADAVIQGVLQATFRNYIVSRAPRSGHPDELRSRRRVSTKGKR
jgi:repressor LexA